LTVDTVHLVVTTLSAQGTRNLDQANC